MAGSGTPNPIGRPTKMTERVLADLRSAFLIGATHEEAYRYAGVSHETFYNYLEKHPDFRDEIKGWQEEPILKARRKVVEDLTKDVKNAQWYLERKRKNEFAQRTEHSGDAGDPIVVSLLGGASVQPDDSTPKDTPAQ